MGFILLFKKSARKFDKKTFSGYTGFVIMTLLFFTHLPMNQENKKRLKDSLTILGSVLVITFVIYTTIKQNLYTSKEHVQENAKTYTRYEPIMQSCFGQEEIEEIQSQCSQTPDPKKCLYMITHVAKHETSCGSQGVGWKNNLFGMTECFQVRNYKCLQRGFKYYSNRMESIKDFLGKYRQYRYNNSCVEMLTRSNYCTSACTNRVDACHETQKLFDQIDS